MNDKKAKDSRFWCEIRGMLEEEEKVKAKRREKRKKPKPPPAPFEQLDLDEILREAEPIIEVSEQEFREVVEPLWEEKRKLQAQGGEIDELPF